MSQCQRVAIAAIGTVQKAANPFGFERLFHNYETLFFLLEKVIVLLDEFPDLVTHPQ